jgi:CheY-like chemotaxis protein
MKGNISVESVIGAGSTFTIKLPTVQSGNVMERITERTKAIVMKPIADQEAAAASSGSVILDDEEDLTTEELAMITPAPMGKSGQRDQTVVVIDDDHSVLELAERVLSKEGYKTVLIDNAQLGLQIVRAKKPEIVILDIMLPGSDGWHILRQIKSDRSCADVKVLMLSVLDERKRANAEGADGFISKPLDRDRLIEVLENIDSGGNMVVILVVEDNPMNRDVLGRRLERRGFEVRFAEDGPTGIEAAKTIMPHLILMDIGLGEMDGCEATRRIKADPKTAKIPVIALTASAFESDRVNALNAGCSDFDTKPVDLARLLGKMDALLSQASRAA